MTFQTSLQVPDYSLLKPCSEFFFSYNSPHYPSWQRPISQAILPNLLSVEAHMTMFSGNELPEKSTTFQEHSFNAARRDLEARVRVTYGISTRAPLVELRL